MVGAILRDAAAGFGLGDTSRMTRQRNQSRCGGRIYQQVRVCSRYCLRAMGTFLDGSADLYIKRGHLRPLRHARHAMMLAVSPTARWQASLSIRPQHEQRGDERKAKNSQQQNGEKLAH